MAKFILCSDLHIRSNRPQYRKDDYFKTAINKFQQIIIAANENNADIICAGDLIDNVRIGYKVVNNMISALSSLNGTMYIVCGQHDMSFHSHDMETSPIQTLLFQDNVKLLNRRKPVKIDNVNIYGCSWEDKPLVSEDKNSILVIHKSITENEPPFFLKDAIQASQAMKEWKYKVTVSGDYHIPFLKRSRGKLLVNCGPMLRQNIGETELKPTIWLLDTDGYRIKRMYLKVEPADDVFSLDKVPEKKESIFTEEITELISSLKDTSGNKPDYKQIVQMVIDKTNPGEAVIKKVNEIIGV
jgi:DNA repair exonuclease SbcCD nuclease subunit